MTFIRSQEYGNFIVLFKKYNVNRQDIIDSFLECMEKPESEPTLNLEQTQVLLAYLILDQYDITKGSAGRYKYNLIRGRDQGMVNLKEDISRMKSIITRVRHHEYRLTPDVRKFRVKFKDYHDARLLREIHEKMTGNDLDSFVDPVGTFLSETEKFNCDMYNFNQIETNRLLTICSKFIKDMTPNSSDMIKQATLFNQVGRTMLALSDHLDKLEAHPERCVIEPVNQNHYDMRFHGSLEGLDENFPMVDKTESQTWVDISTV